MCFAAIPDSAIEIKLNGNLCEKNHEFVVIIPLLFGQG